MISRSTVLPMLLLLASPGAHAPGTLTQERGVVYTSRWIVSWSEYDAVATNRQTGERLTLYRNVTESWADGEGSFGQAGYYEEQSVVLSVVGSFVSFRTTYSGDGGMHPIGGIRIRAVDLDHGGTPASVLTFVEEAPLVHALLRDSEVKERAGNAGASSLHELIALLGRCDFAADELPESFAVVAFTGRRALIRFGIGHSCETARGSYTEINVYAPISAAAAAALRAAHVRGSLLSAFAPE